MLLIPQNVIKTARFWKRYDIKVQITLCSFFSVLKRKQTNNNKLENLADKMEEVEDKLIYLITFEEQVFMCLSPIFLGDQMNWVARQRLIPGNYHLTLSNLLFHF